MTDQGNYDEALEVIKKLVPFREDPQSWKKNELRKKDSNHIGSILEPIPRFDHWEYQQILENGVRTLADKEPYQVARILIDTTASMIRMSMHQDDVDKREGEDYSEIWCRRLDKPDREYRDSKEILVHTLTYACDRVFENASQSIDVLDQTLRNERWKLFSRLRQHLYSRHPNEQTLPWIREMILGHKDYSRWAHHYEFQLMIRNACEHFGPDLLSETEIRTIFDAILAGPSKDDFREWMGDRYSEHAFQQDQRAFHQKQLRPFAALLSGKYQSYYDELELDYKVASISDDSYSPIGAVSVGWVSSRSPKSIEELEKLTDNELLTYMNEWDAEHRDRNDQFVEINISSLASVFQSLFKDKIVPNAERLAFWMQYRDKIERPIYIAAMCKAMQELVKDKHFDQLDQWIEFCVWTLSHSEQNLMDDQLGRTEESREHPDWGTARRAVVDILDACLSEEVNAPIDYKNGFNVLLQELCIQFDWRLDRDLPVLLNRDDQITEAINNTRSRALEALVNYGLWVRRHLPEDSVSEVTVILSIRMSTNAEIPLTRPERAMLGMHFGDLCVLNRDWAAEYRKMLFPQEDRSFWRDAFGSFLRFNNPYQVTFEILREDFEFALEHLVELDAIQDFAETLVDRLGQHLIAYYLWYVYPLKGPESLLERFYELTDVNRQHWAQLFDHVGRSLSNSGKRLEMALVERVIAFFNWRLEVGERSELQEFTFWLKAECLDPEWRLLAYLKILDLKQIRKRGISMDVETLSKLLPDHLPLVVACFAKVTDTIDQDSHLFILPEDAKPILKAGLHAEDPQILANAERARENLLRLGRFDFLDRE
ncbi:MAG: hypothetical protein HGB26_04410 [Desulfobulbaceae bacterium]|nr:hypothetical protein [Desulfobulbaceae bacterium]